MSPPIPDRIRFAAEDAAKAFHRAMESPPDCEGSCPAVPFREAVIALARENGALTEAVDRIEVQIAHISAENAELRRFLEAVNASLSQLVSNTAPVTEFWKDVGTTQRTIQKLAKVVFALVTTVASAWLVITQLLPYLGWHKAP